VIVRIAFGAGAKHDKLHIVKLAAHLLDQFLRFRCLLLGSLFLGDSDLLFRPAALTIFQPLTDHDVAARGLQSPLENFLGLVEFLVARVQFGQFQVELDGVGSLGDLLFELLDRREPRCTVAACLRRGALLDFDFGAAFRVLVAALADRFLDGQFADRAGGLIVTRLRLFDPVPTRDRLIEVSQPGQHAPADAVYFGVLWIYVERLLQID